MTVERPLVEKCEILDEEREVVVRDKRGNPKPNPTLRDYERVPLTEEIDAYYQRECQTTHAGQLAR